jgi:hypothetical protein
VEQRPERRALGLERHHGLEHLVDHLLQRQRRRRGRELVVPQGVELPGVAVEQPGQQVGLVPEELVQRARGDPRPPGDLVGGHLVVPDLGDQLFGGVEDRLDAGTPPSLAAHAGRRAGGGGRWGGSHGCGADVAGRRPLTNTSGDL